MDTLTNLELQRVYKIIDECINLGITINFYNQFEVVGASVNPLNININLQWDYDEIYKKLADKVYEVKKQKENNKKYIEEYYESQLNKKQNNEKYYEKYNR